MKKRFISLDISEIGFGQALQTCLDLAKAKSSSYACFSNVHMVVDAWDHKEVQEAVNQANFAFADGMPIAKGYSLMYKTRQERIAGMDFIEPFLDLMHSNKLRLSIFGGSMKTLAEAEKKIRQDYPGISGIQCISPPFRNWTDEEEKGWIDEISDFSPHVVFVILGCPKQEKFMKKFSSRIPALLLGLGGALPTFLGIQKRAPSWMKALMLEWTYRLIQEPRRLWRRYTYTNLKFIVLFIWFLLLGPKTKKE